MNLFVLFYSTAHASAHAHDNPISITSQTYSIHFPQGIDFQVNAHDGSGNITAASIVLATAIEGPVQEVDPVTVSAPSSTVSLHWHEDMTGNHFLAPGSHISFYWQFRDSSGFHNEAEQQITYIDSRFAWQQAAQGLLHVHWYNQPVDIGQVIVTQASSDLSHISANLGGTLRQPIDLWIYATGDDFRGALPPGTHEWVGGVAFINLNEAFIVVDSPTADTLVRDMPHELTHLLYHQLIGEGYNSPTWFDEGLAVYNQLYHEPEMLQRFKIALTAHTLLRLSAISLDFPADADQAYLAYAQSWQLIDYMYRTFGIAKMETLIKDMGNGNQLSFSDNLSAALGVDQTHLENQWRISLGQPATLSPVTDMLTPQPTARPIKVQVHIVTNPYAPLYTAVGILLIVLPLTGLCVFFVYQRRKRKAAHVIIDAFGESGGDDRQGDDYSSHDLPDTPTYSSPYSTGYPTPTYQAGPASGNQEFPGQQPAHQMPQE